MPFHVQSIVAVPSCCGSPGLVADKEIFSCSPRPRFLGISEPMFQRMAVICSLLLHLWGRICQPLVTPITMLSSHSVTKGQISLCSLTETEHGKLTWIPKRSCHVGYLWAYPVPAVAPSSFPLEKRHKCVPRGPHVTWWLPFVNPVYSHGIGKVMLRCYKGVLGSSLLIYKVTYSTNISWACICWFRLWGWQA